MNRIGEIGPLSAPRTDPVYAQAVSAAVALAEAVGTLATMDVRREPELADAIDTIRNSATCPKQVGRFLTWTEKLIGSHSHSLVYNTIMRVATIRMAAQLSSSSDPLLTVAKELQAAQQESMGGGVNFGDHRKAVAAGAALIVLGDDAVPLRRAVSDMVAGLSDFSARWAPVTAAAAAAKVAINEARFR